MSESDLPDVAVRDWKDLIRRARIGKMRTGFAQALAEYATYENGRHVRPGVARLAVECEMAPATIADELKWLVWVGLAEVVRVGGYRRGNTEYRLIIGPNVGERITVLSPAEYERTIWELNDASGGAKKKKQPGRAPGAVAPALTAQPPAAPGADTVENPAQPTVPTGAVTPAEKVTAPGPSGGGTATAPGGSGSQPGAAPGGTYQLPSTTPTLHKVDLDPDVAVPRARPRLADLLRTATARGIPVAALLAEIDAPPDSPEPGWGDEPTVQMPVIVASASGRHAAVDPDENVLQFRRPESRAS